MKKLEEKLATRCLVCLALGFGLPVVGWPLLPVAAACGAGLVALRVVRAVRGD